MIVKGKHDGTKPLTRDEYREGVFARDGHCWVICGAEIVGAESIKILSGELRARCGIRAGDSAAALLY